MLVKAVLIKNMRGGVIQLMVKAEAREYQALKNFPNRAAGGGLLNYWLKNEESCVTFMKPV